MKLLILALLTLLLLAFVSAAAQTCVYFFYRTGCPHCERVAPLIHQLADAYKLELRMLDVTNQNYYEVFDKLCDRYCVGIRGVPTVFIGDKVIIGDKPIENNLEKEIQRCVVVGCPCPLEFENLVANVTIAGGMTQITAETITPITLAAVLAAALIDSVNPCAIAVLIFLCAYLLAIGSKQKMAICGGIYVGTVFVVYFLSGFGIFSAIQNLAMMALIRNIVVIVALVVGLINIKDYFWYGVGLTLEIPKRVRPKIEELIATATPISAAILGIFVSVVELPCTGGPYLTILTMLADRATMAAAIPYLLIYNLIFILPLVIIIALIYYGYGVEKIEEWRKKERRRMKLVAGFVMLILGILLYVRAI